MSVNGTRRTGLRPRWILGGAGGSHRGQFGDRSKYTRNHTSQVKPSAAVFLGWSSGTKREPTQTPPDSLSNASGSPRGILPGNRPATSHHATTGYFTPIQRGRTNGQQFKPEAEAAADRLTSRPNVLGAEV